MSKPPGATSVETAAPGPPGARAPGSHRGGKRLTVILAVAISVLALASAVIAAAALTHRPHHAPATHPLRGTVFQLRPKQCADFPNGTAVAQVVPCAQPHDAQIYGTVGVAGRHWPGAAVLSAQAQRDCQSKLSGSLSQQVSLGSLAVFYVYPDQDAWAAGGRSVICEIRGTQGKLTGPVRASGG